MFFSDTDNINKLFPGKNNAYHVTSRNGRTDIFLIVGPTRKRMEPAVIFIFYKNYRLGHATVRDIKMVGVRSQNCLLVSTCCSCKLFYRNLCLVTETPITFLLCMYLHTLQATVSSGR